MTDKTSLIAGTGFIATLTLAEFNLIVSITAGVVTIGYVITKWVMLFQQKRTRFHRGEPPID